MVYTPAAMLKGLKSELAAALARHIHATFDVDHQPVVEVPPRRELGDLAFPAPLHLARTLRRRPRDIAEDLIADLELPPPVAAVRVEGAGYLNVFLDRSAVAAELIAAPLFGTADASLDDAAANMKVIVEHTNINPNKAAHIGHLRNSVLGDVLVRALRRLGRPVEVQNYIDDTGVQVADVVVGFLDVREWDLARIEAAGEPFDFLCWDVYSEVGRWYEEDKSRLALRRETLHALEQGDADSSGRAAVGRLIAHRIVGRHLTTMGRIGVDYDVLTRESDILSLDFFAVAFDLLRDAGAIHKATEGKNEGCWVMPLSQSEEFSGLEDPDKVIVRSDGTITYVGKDIAYQMWKFGLLGRDFEYRPWEGAGDRTGSLWRTTAGDGIAEHPSFGAAGKVINVIDARQSYLQRVVRAGLEALGHHEAAAASIHFAYEFVSLSARTAQQLGFVADDGDAGKALEMSGRKGIGVKADDLLDQLAEKAAATIATRHPDLDADTLGSRSRAVAIAAIRFFMAKATTTRVIAFDLDEAIEFKGETGPYIQYSLARESNIHQKMAAAGIDEVDAERVRGLDSALWDDDLWDLALAVAQIPETVEKAADSLELSMIARAAYELATSFHHVYHQHRILDEENADLRQVRLAGFRIFRRGLEELASILGVPVLEQM